MRHRIALLYKRLSHQRFEVEELRAPVARLVDDLSWVAEYAPHLTTHIETVKFSDGRSFGSHWRDDFNYLIDAVARQRTWLGQRTELLRLCVNASSWIAAANALIPEHEDDPESWRDIVSTAEVFTNNPPDRWPSVLRNELVKNILAKAVMAVIGTACFGVPQGYGDTIRVFERLKQSSHSMRVGLVRDMCSLTNDLPYERWFVVRRLKALVLPCWDAIDSFFKRMADDIAAMKPIEGYGQEWEELASTHNEQLQRVLADLRASPEADQP